MNTFIFAASHRPQSKNRRLAELSHRWFAAQGVTTDLAEYSELDTPLFNASISEAGQIPESVQKVADRIARAEALVIASPEYNWSMPGSLKNLIDWLSHLSPCPLAGKTALLMCATPSVRGGAVGLSHLKTTLEAVGMFVFPSALTLGEAGTAFSADGFTDDKNRARFDTLHARFLDYSTRLQQKAA